MELTNQYIAGFFDGEGCVYLQRQKRNYGKCIYISVQVLIGQKDPNVLYAIQKRFGGRIIYKAPTKNHSFIFTWKLHSAKEMIIFLENILPYCIVKEKDIRIGLEILKNVIPSRRGYKGNHISNEEQKIKEELYLQYTQHRKRFLHLEVA